MYVSRIISVAAVENGLGCGRTRREGERERERERESGRDDGVCFWSLSAELVKYEKMSNTNFR